MAAETDTGVARGLLCPNCRKNTLSVSIVRITEFFPEGILEVTFGCEGCNYRSHDVFPAVSSEPCRLMLKVENEEDLNARVAVSSSATVSIPELKAKIKPGPGAQGYISNVEGIQDIRCFSGREEGEKSSGKDKRHERR